jgi:hypothetical protein
VRAQCTPRAAARDLLQRPALAAAVGALLALGLALLLSAPADAGHKRFRPGVTELPEPAVNDLAGMRASGVKVLRVNLSWLSVEKAAPTGGSCGIYDWGEYDRIVLGASRHGVRLLPVIVGSPRYVASAGTHAPFTRDRGEIEAYKCFVRAAVDRYGRDGDFVSSGIRPITEWQVWNEPNFPQFATEERGIDAREYARLVEVTSNAIRSEDDRATIALAGMPETSSRFDPGVFLRGVYAKRGIERKFDVVALHPYSANHRGVEGAVLRLRSALRRLGDANRYVWITEVGWSTQGKSIPFLIKDKQGQARQLGKTFKMLRENRRRWNVGTVFWFRWRDTAAPAEDRETFDYAGLYAKGGAPKPSCHRFAHLSDGRCARIP